MSNKSVEKYVDLLDCKSRSLLGKYTYQPDLTKKLDALNADDLDRETFYEIILWKLNRFPQIDEELLLALKAIKSIPPKQHREASALLRKLLVCKGIALPMASTILRFVNPKTFQIIDDRVFRVVCGEDEKYPVKSPTVSERYLNKSEAIYFNYLDRLQDLSSEELPFDQLDRVLYQLDKERGNRIGD